MILRDHLARDRTVLANERTLLSYIRTAIALLASGGTLLTVFPASLTLRAIGGLLIFAGIAITIFGGWRFTVVAGHMRKVGTGCDTPAREGAEEGGEA
jgi:putative membrane protein